MKKKLIIFVTAVIFLSLVIPTACGIHVASPAQNIENSNVEDEKIYYPFARIEWNIHDTRMEWMNSGLFKGLLSLDEVAYSITGKEGFEFDIAFGFWSKYQVDYGTVRIDPLFRPIIDLELGDIIKWDLLIFNDNMDGEDVWSRFAFGVMIEKNN